MHPSTEDLLSVRDGEPLDAVTSNVIAEDATLEREIERMRQVRHALGRLRDVPPADDMWQRIVAVEHATRPRSNYRRLAAGAGIAAAVAALAIFVISFGPQSRGTSCDQVMNGDDHYAAQVAGGTITHHHAVGRDHLPYMRAEIGELGIEALRAVKECLDPTGIMNPGKLTP